jgi:hypothetical protein
MNDIEIRTATSYHIHAVDIDVFAITFYFCYGTIYLDPTLKLTIILEEQVEYH